jgi:hypothetical protein
MKEVIETIINSTALTLTSFGVISITSGKHIGYFAILFGVGLEFLKYWGRKNKYWK